MRRTEVAHRAGELELTEHGKMVGQPDVAADDAVQTEAVAAPGVLVRLAELRSGRLAILQILAEPALIDQIAWSPATGHSQTSRRSSRQRADADAARHVRRVLRHAGKGRAARRILSEFAAEVVVERAPPLVEEALEQEIWRDFASDSDLPLPRVEPEV